MMQHFGLFINGEEGDGATGERMPIIYPYTGEPYATVAVAAPADVEIEAGRGGELFVLAAGETRDINGELLPMDAIRGGEGRWGMVLRQPLGVIAAIGPFNAPLNLVAQKVAPALAAGNSVVVKPASKTPLAAILLARCIHEAGWPAGACNVLVGSGGSVGDPL